VKDALKAWFFSEVPLPSLYLECNIFVWWSCLELDNAVIRTLSSFQIVLRRLLFIQEIWVENIEFVALDSFRRRIVIVIVLGVIFIPLDCHSPSVNILWLFISETTLSLTWHPIIELFLIFFQSLILFELDNLLSDEVDGVSWIVDDGCAQKVVIFWKRQVVF